MTGTETQREQSEFNSAVSYLNRLNYYFYMADDAAMNLDIYTWFHSLVILFRELSTEMKTEEINAFKNKVSVIAEAVNDYVMNCKKGKTNIETELYNQLSNFEIDLRGIVREAGLQLKMKEDASKALRG